MNEFKGTQGPWKCLREEANKHYIRVSGTKVGERFAVANVLTPPYDDIHEREAKETRANAQLIAAAPELLEALQMIMNGDFYMPKESADAARAAIAKALGESK